MKYLKYLFIITSHFNQVVLQWTSFSPEVIVLLMLQHKEIEQFLINTFQNVLSRTQKQSISLLKTESHRWHRVPGLWGRYTYARAVNIKSLNTFFFLYLYQDPPGITAELNCQREFSRFILMSFPLINICIIQINDNKVRGFPQVVETILID